MSGCSLMGIGFSVKTNMKIPETTAFGKTNVGDIIESLPEYRREKIESRAKELAKDIETNVCEECRKADGQHEKWCSMDYNFK